MEGTILVTGASRGIGRAIAMLFGRRGRNVAVCFRSAYAAAADVVQAINATRGRACAFQVDLSEPSQCEQLVGRVERELGTVSVLINNAGIVPRGALTTISLDEAVNAIAVNVLAPLMLIREVVQPMATRGSGHIVNVGSLHGLVSVSGMVLYSLSKAALHMLTKTAAIELGPLGIRINCVVPGMVATERIVAALRRGACESSFVERIPAGRLVAPEEVAEVVAFLCSPEAAQINGALIVIDGGQTCVANLPSWPPGSWESE